MDIVNDNEVLETDVKDCNDKCQRVNCNAIYYNLQRVNCNA
jgi:hypothetical protein